MMKSIGSLIEIIKKLYFILNRKQKRGAILLLIAIMVSSCLELVGISAILPFIEAISFPEEFMKKSLARAIHQIFGLNDERQMMLILGIVLIMVYLLKNAFLIATSYIQYNYATGIQKDLSIKMLSSYMDRPYIFFTETNSSEIIRGCSGDIECVYNIIAYGTDVVSQCLTVLAIGFFLIYQDFFMAVSTLIFMIIMILFIVYVFKPIIKQLGKESREFSTLTTKSLYQAIIGIKEIMVMQRKEIFLGKYINASSNNRKISRKYNVLNSCPDRIVEAVCVSGIIGIVCIRLFNSGEDMAKFVPTLATFALGAFKMLPSIGKIASRINAVVFSIPGIENVYNNLHQVDEYNSKKLISEKNNELISEKTFESNIEIKHVSWMYPNASSPVLKDVCFRINKGEAVGIIGASGSGKTTFADILLGLMKPKGGDICMDGMDIYNMPYTWARIIGYVPQTMYLTDDSIRNNVAFGVSDHEIDDEQVWNVLEKAQLIDFVKSLPNGIDTMVGEGGVRFSGGQRQRIAIARALYSNPQILVLDEATAALDNETENAVMEAIERLQGQITMIIIAHRLTTIRKCDRIYEISDGIAKERDKNEIITNN